MISLFVEVKVRSVQEFRYKAAEAVTGQCSGGSEASQECGRAHAPAPPRSTLACPATATNIIYGLRKLSSLLSYYFHTYTKINFLNLIFLNI